MNESWSKSQKRAFLLGQVEAANEWCNRLEQMNLKSYRGKAELRKARKLRDEAIKKLAELE